jgi:hypothetical protein
MSLGTQIIYIPRHANGDENHPDCERGFVTTAKNDTVFCRYWRKDLTDLRTKANSEATPIDMIVIRDSVPQEQVSEAIRKYIAGKEVAK